MRRKAVLLFSLACCHTCLQFTYLNSKLFTPKQPHLEVPEHSGGGSRYDVSLSFYPPSDSVSFLATPSPPPRTDVICTWPLIDGARQRRWYISLAAPSMVRFQLTHELLIHIAVRGRHRGQGRRRRRLCAEDGLGPLRRRRRLRAGAVRLELGL